LLKLLTALLSTKTLKYST